MNVCACIYEIFSSVHAVKEARDACCWLKAGGFPQYVHKFEGKTAVLVWENYYIFPEIAGEFPINLTKLEVEKDHKTVLNSADIGSLLK